MEAPEKIYFDESDIRGVLDTYQYKFPHDIFEYVRKDAFIEMACVKLKKLMYDNLMFQGRLHREEVIDNFVEDFKKAMEV